MSRGNINNLTKIGASLSPERAHEMARKSAEVRAKKAEMRKTARHFVNECLNGTITDENGVELIVKDLLMRKLIIKALKDIDLNAIRFILELIGESPADMKDKELEDEAATNKGVNIEKWLEQEMREEQTTDDTNSVNI